LKRRSITAYWLGRIGYDRAHALQRALVEERTSQEPRSLPDVLLLLEHDAVVTMGRGAKIENVLAGEEDLRARGIALAETERGGDVTFHGPGQLVAYPIFDLRPDRCDVRRYVRDLAEVMIGLAGDHKVRAGVLPGDSKYVGVWVDEASPAAWDEANALATLRGDAVVHPARLAKIGAIGVRLSRWVTMHGFAFNVSTDLQGFRVIVPCGISALSVTSLAALGVPSVPTVQAQAQAALSHVARVFDADITLGDAADVRF
jgi:lipoyl(octanoyl) transferase